MQQQQFKVRFSVGTKLLLITGSLLFLTVLFLSLSAVLLMTDDKLAYTFQTKSIEAELAGRDFLKVVENSSDNLRIALSNLDVAKGVLVHSDALQEVVMGQSNLSGIGLGYVNKQTSVLKLVSFVSQPTMTKSAQAPADAAAATAEFTADAIKSAWPELTKNGMGFVNLAKADRLPLLGVLFEDRAAPPIADGVPVAVGFLPMGPLVSEFSDLDLAIGTKSGWLLLDSNSVGSSERPNLSQDPLFAAALSNSMQTGTLDYQTGSKRILGGYSKPGFDLVVLTKADWQRAMRATYTLAAKFVMLGCMAIGLGTVFIIFFAKTLTAPINRLYEATREVAAGNFEINILPTVRDEIGALTASFNVMSSKVRELLKDSVDKAILEKEIDIASTVQKTLIPGNSADLHGVKIRAQYQSASSCGGDWWGYFNVGSKIVVGVADATGHGLASALITASARSCFSVMQLLAETEPSFAFSPCGMLDYANRVIFDCANGGIMMTFFLAVIDLEAGTITYSNAAHNPPWLLRKVESGFKLNSLVSTGTRLGEAVSLKEPLTDKVLSFESGDLFFLYTDGLTEGKNQAGEMFGKKKVRQLVEGQAPQGPDAIVSKLIEGFMAHNKDKALDDDVTVIAMSLNKSALSG
jgi:serine phosphatase RsbU (regulator of sigma subunit)